MGLAREGAGGFFILLGLLSAGLIAGALTGGNDDDPAPDRDRIVEGSDAEDTLSGSGTNDLIFGQPGDDWISGGNGDDIVSGGAGTDTLRGDSGNDIIAGGAGADAASGGRGDDLMLGGEGDDTLNGNDDNDSLYGISGADRLFGNDGDDLLSGIDVPGGWSISAEIEDLIAEKLAADHGDAATGAIGQRVLDQLSSHSGNASVQLADSLEGGQGNDTLLGDSGDTLTGGLGLDRFVVDSARADLAPGASGYDPVVISDYDTGTATEEGEQIILRVVGDPAAPPELSLRQVGTGVELRLDDETVAVLANRGLASVDAGRITVEVRPALDGAAGLA